MDTEETKEHHEDKETHDENHNEQHGKLKPHEPKLYEIVLQSMHRHSDEEETDHIQKILEEILTRKRIFKDEKDDSVHPSFTNFKVPYHMTCQLRYSNKRKEYENQFQHELNEILHHQPTAYDAARFNRHLCISTLWPPLHNRREIEYFQNNFFRLNYKQKKRLEILMNTKIN